MGCLTRVPAHEHGLLAPLRAAPARGKACASPKHAAAPRLRGLHPQLGTALRRRPRGPPGAGSRLRGHAHAGRARRHQRNGRKCCRHRPRTLKTRDPSHGAKEPTGFSPAGAEQSTNTPARGGPPHHRGGWQEGTNTPSRPAASPRNAEGREAAPAAGPGGRHMPGGECRTHGSLVAVDLGVVEGLHGGRRRRKAGGRRGGGG